MTIIIVPTESCQFRCAYCLRGDSRILMEDWSWKPIKDIKIGERVVGYNKRKTEVTEVTQIFKRQDTLFQLKTETGILYLTEEHPILSKYGRWCHIGQKPIQIGREVKKSLDVIEVQQTEDFKRGYLSGAIHGDGTLKTYKYQREWGTERIYRFRFVVKDNEFYERVKQYLVEFEIDFNEYDFDMNGTKVSAIYRNSKEHFNIISQLTKIDDNPSSEWLRGFVSGMFDAEGSINTQPTVRMINTDNLLLSKYCEGLKRFNFNYVIENYKEHIKTIRLLGGIREKVRFVSLFDLAITRKKNGLLGHQLNSYEKIESIEKQGFDDVYNLETKTGNYIAEGFIVHNCFEPNEQHTGLDIPYNFEAIKKSVDEIWGGPYKGSDLCLHGGEPTLIPRSEMGNLLEHLYKYKQVINIVTNGYKIDDYHIALFKKYNVYVGLSWDGPPELNILRGPNPNDPDITAFYNENIQRVAKRMREESVWISIMCILHKANASTPEKLEKLMEWIKSLRSLGIRGGRMNLMYASTQAKEKHELSTEEALRAWITLYEFNKKERLNYNPFREMVKNLLGCKPSPCVFNRCDFFNTHTISVLPDGTIGNCDRTFAHGIYIRSQSGTKSGRYEILQQVQCKDCRYWNVCGGGCPLEGEDFDWRNKTKLCKVIYGMYEYIENDLRGTLPGISLITDNDFNGDPFKNFSKKQFVADVEQRLDPLHGDSPHDDTTHGDTIHGDSNHADEVHGDNVHHDTIHGDTIHGDTAHGDDVHGDTTHGDSVHGDMEHGDISHGDSSHGDNPDWR